MNVISWNVNGLKRKLGDYDFLEYISSYDLIFLSETWISNKDNINSDINGYNSEHLFGNKSKNTTKGRYSGGIAFYYKNELKNFITIVEKQQFGLIWVKISADLFPFDENVYLCHIYMPPNDSKVFRSSQIDFFEQLELSIVKYSNMGKIFITGDMNSRTSNSPDFFLNLTNILIMTYFIKIVMIYQKEQIKTIYMTIMD